MKGIQDKFKGIHTQIYNELLTSKDKGKLLKAEKNDALHIGKLQFKILWISYQKTQTSEDRGIPSLKC